MSTERRTYARPRTFDVECARCGRLHVVNRPHVKTASWNPRSSVLTCHCGKVWIVGLALWDPMPGIAPGGRPTDQIPSRHTLQELRGVLAGRIVREGERGRYGRSLVVRELEAAGSCSCSYQAPPFQHLRRTDPDCPKHGAGARGGSAKGGVDK